MNLITIASELVFAALFVATFISWLRRRRAASASERRSTAPELS